MNVLDRNNFVVTHASVEYFAKDLEYYKKLFPNSVLINDLENCPDFRKKEFDARMLHEMLASERICHECILENRGIITLEQKMIDEQNAAAKFEQAKTELLNIDLTLKFDFNKVKKMAEQAGVTLQGKSKADLIASIELWKNAIEAPAQPVNTDKENKEQGSQTTAENPTPAPDKKKEGPE